MHWGELGRLAEQGVSDFGKDVLQDPVTAPFTEEKEDWALGGEVGREAEPGASGEAEDAADDGSSLDVRISEDYFIEWGPSFIVFLSDCGAAVSLAMTGSQELSCLPRCVEVVSLDSEGHAVGGNDLEIAGGPLVVCGEGLNSLSHATSTSRDRAASRDRGGA